MSLKQDLADPETYVPLRAFLSQMQEMKVLTELSANGLKMAIRMPALVDDPRFSEFLKPLVPPEAITQWESEAKAARAFVASGFRPLAEQLVVFAWAYFEASVRDFVVDFSLAHPESREKRKLKATKVSLLDYEEATTDQERAHIALRAFEDAQGSAPKGGAAQLERVLGFVGLDGAFPPKMERDVNEMHAIRNCLVHRGGICDRRFKTQCPWRSDPLGTQIALVLDDASRFVGVLHRYAGVIFGRAAEVVRRLGAPGPRPDAAGGL